MTRFIVILTVIMVVSGLSKGYAAESNAYITSHTRATLVSDRDTVGPNGTLNVGLRLQLRPGWHTYWINPGDAGDAPQLNVKATGGQYGESHDIHWPVPEKINEGGLMAYAYTGDVLLPQKLTLKGNGSTILKAHAEWLVCADVCVPEQSDFTLTLPYSSLPSSEGREASLFHAADQAMPTPSPFDVFLSPQGVLNVEGDSISSLLVEKAWFLPTQPGLISQTSKQKLSVSPHHFTLELTPDLNQSKPLWKKSLSGVIVMVDHTGARSAISITAHPREDAALSQRGSSAVSSLSKNSLMEVGKVLICAFLGGVILNLMPCVFPVLAMKALFLVRMGGVGRRQHIESACFYALGVVVSFALLGTVMIVLRYLGAVSGWGFQFQSSSFVIAVCWLLFMMALNLLGVFQLTTGRLVNRLENITRSHGCYGDLFTGLLAVIVATPCTAPFMGVAIAGALSSSVLLGVVIFMIMGLGLAAPYVVIATIPGMASRLPRPGEWMDVLKQFLAFPLLATCVWLLWVVALQRGAFFVLITAGGAVFLALSGWSYGLSQRRAMSQGGHNSIRFYKILAIICIILSVLVFVKANIEERTNNSKALLSSGLSNVEPFSEHRLDVLRSEERPVFVDMTASWCITCLVNEKVALNVASVQSVIKNHHVVILRGDWTNRDKAISNYLAKHNRDGVPFYMYYPEHKEGIRLPQILTPHDIIQAISH